MLLKKKSRQRYLKELGFYDGKVDGEWGNKSKAALLKLQKKYFRRAKDRDGKYGKYSDILLRSAYACRDEKSPYFNLEEFRCPCGHCTGYPTRISSRLLRNLNNLRRKFGPLTVTSGLRCKWFNDSLRGSWNRSYHMRGMAADVKGKATTSRSGKLRVISYFKGMKHSGYTYANTNGNYPWMGNAVHCGVVKKYLD